MKTETQDNVIFLGLRISQGKAGWSSGLLSPSMLLPPTLPFHISREEKSHINLTEPKSMLYKTLNMWFLKL